MTTYYHRSANRLADLRAIQKNEGLPETQPLVTENSVRRHYSHDSMEWFRVGQRAVQIYDVKHGAKARHDDGPYGESHMDHADWTLNCDSVIVLQPAAQGVKMIEGPKYIMSSLVLPLIHQMIAALKKPELIPHWDAENAIPTTHQTPELKAAKRLYLHAMMKRFIDDFPLRTKAQYAICTFLDPRFKKYPFTSPAEREWAENELRKEWASWYVQVPDTDCLQVAGMPEIVPHEKELGDFFDFFSVPKKLNQLEQPAKDELEVYMAMPAEPKNCDVIACWHICRHRTPRLAKMAQQFLELQLQVQVWSGCSVQRASITLILLQYA